MMRKIYYFGNIVTICKNRNQFLLPVTIKSGNTLVNMKIQFIVVCCILQLAYGANVHRGIGQFNWIYSIRTSQVFEITSPVHLVNSPVPISSRTLGGIDAPDGYAPFQCSLQFYREHLCGCAIISAEWILSAAHCLDRYR